MSSEGDGFRINVRLNRHEYGDIEQHLSQFSGSNKGARVRLLLRLGMHALLGHSQAVEASSLHQAGIPLTTTSKAVRHPSSKPQTSHRAHDDTADRLITMGLDPANFQFGANR